jgi:hypothetical protein
MPARRARSRISPARMKLSWPTCSPGGWAASRARWSAAVNGARSSCLTQGTTRRGPRWFDPGPAAGAVNGPPRPSVEPVEDGTDARTEVIPMRTATGSWSA